MNLDWGPPTNWRRVILRFALILFCSSAVAYTWAPELFDLFGYHDVQNCKYWRGPVTSDIDVCYKSPDHACTLVCLPAARALPRICDQFKGCSELCL